LENPGVDGYNIKMAPSEAEIDDVFANCAAGHSLKWQAVVNMSMNLKVASKPGK
jgi:hypothetical protein